MIPQFHTHSGDSHTNGPSINGRSNKVTLSTSKWRKKMREMKLDIMSLQYLFWSWLWQFLCHRMEADLPSHTSAYNNADQISKTTRQFPERNNEISNLIFLLYVGVKCDRESLVLIPPHFRKTHVGSPKKKEVKTGSRKKAYRDNKEPVVWWTGHIPCKGPSPCYYMSHE